MTNDNFTGMLSENCYPWNPHPQPFVQPWWGTTTVYPTVEPRFHKRKDGSVWYVGNVWNEDTLAYESAEFCVVPPISRVGEQA